MYRHVYAPQTLRIVFYAVVRDLTGIRLVSSIANVFPSKICFLNFILFSFAFVFCSILWFLWMNKRGSTHWPNLNAFDQSIISLRGQLAASLRQQRPTFLRRFLQLPPFGHQFLFR